MAVNLGNDADTTVAIFGQLAGAFYGISGIRQDWASCITNNTFILELAERLCERSQYQDTKGGLSC